MPLYWWCVTIMNNNFKSTFRKKGQNVNNMTVSTNTNDPSVAHWLTMEAQSLAPTISAAFSSICKEWELHEWTWTPIQCIRHAEHILSLSNQRPPLYLNHSAADWGALSHHNNKLKCFWLKLQEKIGSVCTLSKILTLYIKHWLTRENDWQ